MRSSAATVDHYQDTHTVIDGDFTWENVANPWEPLFTRLKPINFR